MFDQLIARWWIVASRGIVAMAFGVTAFLAPEATLAFLVSLFGLFALADGIFTMGAGLSVNWVSLFMEGVVGGAVGLLTLFYPATAQLWFVSLIMAWAFVTGVLELAGAFTLRQTVKGPMVKGEWLLGASGLLSLVFGTVVAARPDAGPAAFMWTIGAYAILSGALLLALAVNIRSWPRLLPRGAAA
jgi:uncharacterized membrane protein HdeD (DUF308 family)